jgi:hypothetical protein
LPILDTISGYYKVTFRDPPMATAQVMKDTELRGLILQAFYDRRQAQSIESPTAGWIDGKTSNDEIYRICKQLGGHGLIKWNPFMGGGGVGVITAYGVDVVEGQRSPDIAVQLVHYTTNISNSSNVIVGNNNSQTIVNAFEEILRAIEASSGDDASKAESKLCSPSWLALP